MAGFNDAPLLQKLAIPAVVALVVFLGYTSQIFFHLTSPDALAPGPLTKRQTIVFNALLACLWWTYYRACTVSSGVYHFSEDDLAKAKATAVPDGSGGARRRWCTKCRAPKPPRAHHCRTCGRCIPRMDHHCPWTGNCVSMTTFPHFMRFLVYTNLSLWTLGYFLAQRFAALWRARDLPAYLGPDLTTLIYLTVLSLVCFFTSLALALMLMSTARGWVLNMTMIEGWEQEKHEGFTDHRGGARDWWAVTGPDGEKMRIERVEFPYDLDFFANMAQAMGTPNVLMWFFPFASGPKISPDGKGAGWTWEENGINDREDMWPPIDPEKLRRSARGGWPGAREEDADGEVGISYSSPEDEIAAFKARQAADLRRWQGQRSRLIAELEEVEDYDIVQDGEGFYEGRTGWKNADGEDLYDYGVDDEDEEEVDEEIISREAAALYDDDEDIPLGELLRRRKVLQRDSADD